MADIVIFGAGQMAAVATVYLKAHGKDRIVGYTVDSARKDADTFQGLPVVDWESLEQRFSPGSVRLLGPLSYARLNDLRRDRHLEGKARGYTFTSFVHPSAHVYTDQIGENCMILEGNVIQPFARIGAGVIMWSGNHVGHHAVLGDHCFLSSQVGLGGGVRIGARCFLAGKVGVETGVEIGEACYLDTGVIVKKDLPAETVVRRKNDRIAHLSSLRLKRLRFR